VADTERRSTGGPLGGKVLLAFATVYLVWGSTYLAIRWAIETMPPFLMAGVRFLLAGALIAGWSFARGAAWPKAVHWRRSAVVGLLLLLGGNGGVVWAELYVPSGLAALLVATVPLWMVLVDALWKGGSFPPLRVWFGIALGLVGVALLAQPSAEGSSPRYVWGALALIGASLSWSVGSVYARRVPIPVAPVLATGMQMLAGGAGLLLFGLLVGEGPRLDLAAISARSWLAFVYLLVLGSIVGYTAYVYLLHHTTPALASTYAYVNPVIAVLLGWAIAGEPLTGRTLVAAAVILAGVVVITLARRNGGLGGGLRAWRRRRRGGQRSEPVPEGGA
jgi:drug/metabolite transporter (DMT)-like permease